MKGQLLAALFMLLASYNALGQPQEKVLWSFQGAPNDGSHPSAKLVLDKSGNLYGTTEWGGSHDWGTVFKLSPLPDGTWTETILYSFCEEFNGVSCPDGANPDAGLILDLKGNLYGTTSSGGGDLCPFGPGGCGTVFELSPPSVPNGVWSYTLLYQFCQTGNGKACPDGSRPYSKLTLDAAGNLYGTASAYGMGGAGGSGGVVFKLSSGDWKQTVIYNFCSVGSNGHCLDGSAPRAGVAFDKAGNLYGTTSAGGSAKFDGGGVVYKLSPGQGGWKQTVLFAFPSASGPKGGDLLGTVNFDPAGNLFSTAYQGGTSNLGVLFRLSPKNGGSETSLSFDGSNGAQPAAGVLIDSRNGNLYGTTSGKDFDGLGTVFRVVGKNLTVLHQFGSNGDGRVPMAGLEADKKGRLYGTTRWGGTANLGVVFQITP